MVLALVSAFATCSLHKTRLFLHNISVSTREGPERRNVVFETALSPPAGCIKLNYFCIKNPCPRLAILSFRHFDSRDSTILSSLSRGELDTQVYENCSSSVQYLIFRLLVPKSVWRPRETTWECPEVTVRRYRLEEHFLTFQGTGFRLASEQNLPMCGVMICSETKLKIPI